MAMDDKYNNLCAAIFDELDRHVKVHGNTRQTRKRLKIHKPYWNEGLYLLWKKVSGCEKVYVKYKGSRQRKHQLH